MITLRRGSSAVSPTAHYTGEVWRRNGLSHPQLGTTEGRAIHALTSPLFGGILDGMLLARHRAIDAALERAIAQRGVTQVLEVACGMSPRGWRFAERHGPGLTYVEADLPAMAARKREALERIGAAGGEHRVVELDALAEDGPASLDAVLAPLDRGRGLAIVTEGLLTYLPGDEVRGLWRRFAAALSEFDGGLYVSDLQVASESGDLRTRLFRVGLAGFVRGRVYVHFPEAAQAEAALLEAGFGTARVSPASDGTRIQVLEASV